MKKYLDENYAKKIVLDNLCTRFYISKYYLTHSFKDQFIVPITNYLLPVRITHAKQMLRFSDKTVEEIGYEVGIGPPAYFSRAFKEVEGVSPSVYREQW